MIMLYFIRIGIYNHKLSKFTKYFDLNKLTLNLDKTTFLNISSRNRTIDKDLIPVYENTPIEEVDQMRYLGIIIDKHLTLKPHVNSNIKKISSSVSI